MTNNRIKYEQLVAYAAGELTTDEADSVKAYIKVNPAAAQTVATYKQARLAANTDESIAPPQKLVARAKSIFNIQAAIPAISWLDQLQQIIANMVFDSRAQPALAGIRGVGTTFQATYETDQVSVDIEAQPIEESMGEFTSQQRWRVMGQLDMPETVSNIDVAMISTSAATDAIQTQTDEHGMFSIEVEAGTYDLLIRCGDSVVVLNNIVIA